MAAEPARQELSAPATVTVRSRRFGAYEVPLDRVLHFPDGLIGFPGGRRFALLEAHRQDSPFRQFVCLDLPEVGFVVCDPETFWPGYPQHVRLPEGLTPETLPAVLVIVTVPANPLQMTANLLAPLVLDAATRQGWQVVLEGGPYGTQHPVLPAAAAAPPPPPAR